MKSIGIVRKIDELGRIVLPIETRRQLGLDAKDGVEIFVDEYNKTILSRVAEGPALRSPATVANPRGICDTVPNPSR